MVGRHDSMNPLEDAHIPVALVATDAHRTRVHIVAREDVRDIDRSQTVIQRDFEVEQPVGGLLDLGAKSLACKNATVDQQIGRNEIQIAFENGLE